MATRIFFALITLIFLGLAIASSVYILEKVEKPKGEVVREIKTAAPPQPIDPGVGEFDAAMDLVKNRDVTAARDKLRYIIRYFPKSERYSAAVRLCTEMNLDMLISPKISENKTTYEVQRGDVLSRIAKKHLTTIECIARVNGLSHYKIVPGDQLVLVPLEFKVYIKEKKLTLTQGEEFFAQYNIREIHLPSGVSVPFQDQIRSKRAVSGKKQVSVTGSGYDSARKKLRLRRPGISIRPPSEKTTEGAQPETGIFMDPADIDELTMLLRVGTPIHVTP